MRKMKKLLVTALVVVLFCLNLTTTHPIANIGPEYETEVLSDSQKIVDLDIDENVGHLNSKSYEEVAEDSNSSSIFQNILRNIRKGQVTKDSLSSWMSQIQNDVSRGILSSQAVSRFMATLKEKLAGTSIGENCCPLG